MGKQGSAGDTQGRWHLWEPAHLEGPRTGRAALRAERGTRPGAEVSREPQQVTRLTWEGAGQGCPVASR